MRVPASNMLLGEGRGFEIAQGAWGQGASITACGALAWRSALETMCKRVQSRVAFGKPLADQGTIRADIANSRMEIEQARLLTLKTAYLMDTVGNKEARAEIAMIKVVAPDVALRVLDRSIQAHGGGGVSQDTFLAAAWAGVRILRSLTGRTKSTRNRSPKMNSGNGPSLRRAPRPDELSGLPRSGLAFSKGEFMPPLVVETPRSLSEFAGSEIAVTEWFTVTQDRIQQFAEVTKDRQWIHLDTDRARRESPFGTTIAHGFLTLSLVSHFVRHAVQIRSGVRMGVNYGLNRVRFPSPVRGQFANSCPRESPFREGTCGGRRSRFWDIGRRPRRRETSLRGGMDCPLLPIREEREIWHRSTKRLSNCSVFGGLQ